MIEKNIRLQPHHARDLLVGRRSDGRRPGYQPPGRDYGGPSSGGPGPGGQGARGQATQNPGRTSPEPSRGPVTTAVAPPSILAGPPVEPSTGPDLHGWDQKDVKKAVDLGEKTKAIRDIIKQGQEEKYGATADPTKFGETISKLDVAMSKKESDRTIDDKLAIEEWENEQDWDKVQDLADKGHSSDDIQKAMDKGLLTKASVIEQQGAQGLIERGLAAIMPKTKLESSLLSKLKKSIDPKSIAGGMLKSAAMKKLGLGWLNPILGLASLFGFDPIKKAQTAFAKKPTDMSAFNKLGLYDAGISTTDTAKRVGEKTIGSDIALGKKGVFESGQELLGLKDIKEHRAEVTRPQYNTLKTLGQVGNVGGSAEEVKGLVPEGTFDSIEPSEWDQIFSGAKYKDIKQVAQGGRIDKPLIGRSRYI